MAVNTGIAEVAEKLLQLNLVSRNSSNPGQIGLIKDRSMGESLTGRDSGSIPKSRCLASTSQSNLR